MGILVIGGTGKVGRQTVLGLLRRGVTIKVMTRAAEKAHALPQGVSGVVADMARPDTLPPAFEDVEACFLITPVSRHETAYGLAAVEAARTRGVRRLVYLSVVMPPGSERIPHFQSKIPIEEAIKRSDMAYTILHPNNFFQNDYLFKDVITQDGIYPEPVGRIGLNRVDVRDIADAAVSALTESGYHGQTYPVVGPDVLTGDSIAAIYARHLERDVCYGGDDLDRWEQQARHMLPDWMVHDLRIMFQYFQEHGLRATQADLALQQRLLHHPPRGFEAFVRELAPAWKHGPVQEDR
jgi:uncharacterized protein YbjT (DUF2867 family)